MIGHFISFNDATPVPRPPRALTPSNASYSLKTTPFSVADNLEERQGQGFARQMFSPRAASDWFGSSESGSSRPSTASSYRTAKSASTVSAATQPQQPPPHRALHRPFHPRSTCCPHCSPI